MAGFVRKHVTFRDEVIMEVHLLLDPLISYQRDGVNIYDVLFSSTRGPSRALPYNVERFREQFLIIHTIVFPCTFSNAHW